MLTDVWPLFGLVLRTPRLELRVPSLEQLAGLAELADEGVHDPAAMPFLVPWTDLPPGPRGRSVMQHQWQSVGCADPAAVVARARGAGRRRAGRHPGASVAPSSRSPVRCTPAPGWAAGTTAAASAPRCGPPCCTWPSPASGPTGRSRPRGRQPASIGVSRKLGYAEDGVAVRDRARTAPDRPAVPDRPGDLGGPADRAGTDRGLGAVPGAARRGQPGCRRRHRLSRARSMTLSAASSRNSG